jgi:hypothetical protein
MSRRVKRKGVEVQQVEADLLTETPVPVTKKGKTAQLVTQQVEKRAARTRSFMNRDTMIRVDRALTQRLYLLNQIDISTPGNLGRKYDVLGSTGNVYEVEISRVPSCNCPDSARGNLCKHILFVYLRVLRCQPRSTIIIQKALLQEELASIFASRSSISSDVQASKDVMRVYSNSTQRSKDIIGLVDLVGEAKEQKATGEDPPEEIKPDEDCPICFESMSTKEALDRCQTCRKFIHLDCLRRWLGQSRTCVYCRSVWAMPGTTGSNLKPGGRVSASQMGGYLNIS